jgi:hypothetical protein
VLGRINVAVGVLRRSPIQSGRAGRTQGWVELSLCLLDLDDAGWASLVGPSVQQSALAAGDGKAHSASVALSDDRRLHLVSLPPSALPPEQSQWEEHAHAVLAHEYPERWQVMLTCAEAGARRLIGYWVADQTVPVDTDQPSST